MIAEQPFYLRSFSTDAHARPYHRILSGRSSFQKKGLGRR
jgi:hypothetical protein